MKYTTSITVALVLIAICASAMSLAARTTYTSSTPENVALGRTQRAWLGALEWCESRGRQEAVNPEDLDGTPSYGLLQFKPATFAEFQKKYGIEGTLMDPDVQEKIVEQMILRGGVNWQRQFPDCVKRLGLPPKLSTTSVTSSY